MLYLQGISIGLMIVLGQVLWKIGIEKIGDINGIGSLLSGQLTRIVFSPYIIAGVVSYGIATLVYMILLSKYEYTDLQAVVVSSSLIITFIAASALFSEKISYVNLIGLVFLICGVYLITRQ